MGFTSNDNLMVLIESLAAIGSRTRRFQKAQMGSNESCSLSSNCFGLLFYYLRRRRGKLLVVYNTISSGLMAFTVFHI